MGFPLRFEGPREAVGGISAPQRLLAHPEQVGFDVGNFFLLLVPFGVRPQTRGTFWGFYFFGFGLKEGFYQQARLDSLFRGFFVVVAGGRCRDVEGIVGNRGVVVRGELAVGVVVATVGNFPSIAVVPVFQRGPEIVTS